MSDQRALIDIVGEDVGSFQFLFSCEERFGIEMENDSFWRIVDALPKVKKHDRIEKIMSVDASIECRHREPMIQNRGVDVMLGTRRPENQNKVKPDIELTDSEGKPVKLTLVTVGVDKVGTDLHYNFNPKFHTTETIPDIENESLCTEYPRTPGIAEKFKVNLPALEPYVLFKYAMVKDEV